MSDQTTESRKSELAEATATFAQLTSLDISDPNSHSDIVRKCQRVIDTLQDPKEAAMENFYGVVKFPCISALNDLDIFKKLSEGPLTAKQLAEQCGADRWLIVRLMRVATGWGIVSEIGLETYAATSISNVLATVPCSAGLRVCQRIHKILDNLPAYLKETEYRNVGSTDRGIFQYTFGTDLRSFQYLAPDKEAMRDFNLFMTIQRTQGQQWTEHFDVKSRVFDDVTVDENAPLVVDIGGGIGKDLLLLKKALTSPDLRTYSGQFVLEDQDHVIDAVPTETYDPEVKYVKHNFFAPQPVKGARVYTLKHVLHNWPDRLALQILRHTVAGLTPGYSKIWILDGVVPDTGADRALASLDIGMMGIHGALERNKEQWTQLLAEAGLKITSLSVLPDGYALIEAVLEG